ncbi:hypothetical protein [Novosphingobium sp. JCM 18896]|uniref:hypothetical protein n=1 Tax=Novosphingobium sp. JCM 18896 TaxID=2989731 RepID=UPI0022214F05|nr:hypothetical protein [Novosphingobium sp. JCM 18896]MCW1431548.1 hypothetical protein [Novosphingobium sp. JCM 18896]
MTGTYRFQNAGSDPMVVRIEMWCDEIRVPVGSVLVLTCHSLTQPQPATIERTPDGLVFWPECASYAAELDGRPYPLPSQA